MTIFEYASATKTEWLFLAALSGLAYGTARCVYLLYFHPASKFPGPKLAAVTYGVYAYHWIRGRWPWFQEAMLETYGDVVRVAPNEIVFFTPQAALDIYGPSVKNHETFQKTDLMDFGAGDLGFIWEKDPAKRRAVAKKILPAFSTKATKSKEPVVQMYMDIFVSKMKELGGGVEGLEMGTWLYWLGVDMGADLAYSREMHHVRDGKSSDFVDMFRLTSLPGTIIQVSKKFPLVAPLALVASPLNTLSLASKVFKANSAAVQKRIDNRGKTKHPDFMDYMIPTDGPPPTSKKDLVHVEQVALQMFIAGFDPVQITFYGVLFFLLRNPETLATLTAEIRGAFKSYDDINSDTLVPLKYLNGVIQETLRVHATAANGLPRISPGATVDGVYVPKGVVVQISTFTAARSARYFRDPREFHPERWLPTDHPLYNTKYADDNLKAFFPFSLGPRQCTGKEIAYTQTRLFLGKVLWTFDLEGTRGLDATFDENFSVHVLWNRPEMYVRFKPRDISNGG